MDSFCDENGVCSPADLNGTSSKIDAPSGISIIYVGDPMCSWCWGISNHLKNIKDIYGKKDIDFEIVLGGLRPGGGDPWDDQMKDFLKHHWEEVNKRSGQPFGMKLFNRQYFNYDTEPSCRAVMFAKENLDRDKVLLFFEEVQRKFYVENQDPGEPEFYQSICEDFAVPFELFEKQFASDQLKANTKKDFVLNREWGVKGYPTVLLKKEDQLFLVANGYATFELMSERIDKLISEMEKEAS